MGLPCTLRAKKSSFIFSGLTSGDHREVGDFTQSNTSLAFVSGGHPFQPGAHDILRLNCRYLMASTNKIQCPKCKAMTDHFHSSGWWKCQKCKNNTVKANLGNTNKGRGEDRGFDASGEAHGMAAKGSLGGAVKKR